MPQQVIAFLTDCNEARDHLRKLRTLVEILGECMDDDLAYKSWMMERMTREISDCAKALGLKL